MAELCLVAAMARNRVIGAGNRMPWYLPEDFKYFKQLTLGHPIVMGRKTYESIGRLLPGRENRIVSRQPGFAVEGAKVFSSLDAACEGPGTVFVIGGGELYAQALPRASRIYLTLVDAEVEGDAYFPAWPEAEFRELSREARAADPAAGRPYGFAWIVLERIK